MKTENRFIKTALIVISVALAAAQTSRAQAKLSFERTSANTVSINLENSTPVAGMQLTINASSNLAISALQKIERIENSSWQLYQYQPNDSTINLVILNANPISLPQGAGAFARFTLTGNNVPAATGSRLTFSNVVIADERAQRVAVSFRSLEWTSSIAQSDQQFTLEQNYPNPFNPTTTIRYKLEQPGQVRLSIFDITGREVMRVLDQYQGGGTYSVMWNGKNEEGQPLASGVYVARLNVNGGITTMRMTLMK